MRPIQTRSRYGSAAERLNLASPTQLVGSLCKRHAVTAQRTAPTACRRAVSGSLSLPCSGCFPPFPRGTGSLSVFGSIQPCGMVPAGSDRIPRAPPYSGASPRNDPLPVRGCHPLRRRFPNAFRFLSLHSRSGPTTPERPEAPRFRLVPFRSPLLRESILSFFSSGY